MDGLIDNTNIILYIILINYYYKEKQARGEMLVATYDSNIFLSRNIYDSFNPHNNPIWWIILVYMYYWYK